MRDLQRHGLGSDGMALADSSTDSSRPGLAGAELEDMAAEPVVDLLWHYDLAAIHLGWLSFFGPWTFDDRMTIGAFDVNPLYVSRTTQEIYVGGLDEPARVRWVCARDQASFLEALSVLVPLRSPFVDNDWLLEEPTTLHWYATMCGQKAGGAVYARFYRALLDSMTY